MTYLRMEDLDLTGRRILIREDLNVPIADGAVTNDTRIRAALPTIEQARKQAARKIILMSHLGRPTEGEPVAGQRQLSLHPVAARLASLLDCEVQLISNYLEQPPAIDAGDAEVVLLENVRVNVGEKSNADQLARQYAALCDVFVMDAFATAHRAQASTHGVARYADQVCAGPLLARELEALDRSLTDPARPLLAIVGGAKVSGKLEVLRNLATRVDRLIVGGGIANTFLLANGVNIGQSLCEPALVETARELMHTVDVLLPDDVVVATEFSPTAEATTKAVADIEANELILDIGPETARRFAELISGMETIIWNGPVGVFEYEQFAAGTETVTRAVADSRGYSIAGGGETIAAIDKFGVAGAISYISTGGGAFLEYVQGTELPAVQILKERARQVNPP